MKLLFVSPHADDMKSAGQLSRALGLEIVSIRARKPVPGFRHAVHKAYHLLDADPKSYRAAVFVLDDPVTSARLVRLGRKLQEKEPGWFVGRLFVRTDDLGQISQLAGAGFWRTGGKSEPADIAIAQSLGRANDYRQWLEEQRRPRAISG